MDISNTKNKCQGVVSKMGYGETKCTCGHNQMEHRISDSSCKKCKCHIFLDLEINDRKHNEDGSGEE